MLLPLPVAPRARRPAARGVDWRDPAVKQVFVLMLPVTLGLGLINFNAVVDTLFASRLIDPELAPTAIDHAFRLYMLPQGIFSVAVATVLFPSLSRLAARGRHGGFRRHGRRGAAPDRASCSFPASVACAVLATPIVRARLPARRVHADQTDVVAACLAAFSLGLDVQRRDADAQPLVLQPAVALDADDGRARATWA